ncbi:MAG: ABC transporter substrate-binding protein [Bacteroidota bacterium]
MKKVSLTVFFPALLMIASCNSDQKEAVNKPSEQAETALVSLNYAEKLKIDHVQNISIVQITEPFKGAETSLTYYLIPKDQEVPDSLRSTRIIRTPVEKFACTSTTHLPGLTLLNTESTLVGFPSLALVSAPSITTRIEAGEVAELGKDYSLNTEVVLEVDPELLMTFTMDGNYKHLSPLSKAGIATIVNADYLETTPLGRAEWIKLFGALFQKTEMADSVFISIESEYNRVKDLLSTVEKKPTTFNGMDYNGVWYMPGGNSWMAKFLSDAGADYLWKENTETGSIELSFEAVYDRAVEADIWLNVHGFNTLSELEAADERYSKFKAYETGMVFNSNARANENGGDDYYEAGFSRPDLVLKDLAKIFHPEIMAEHDLYFYKQLK